MRKEKRFLLFLILVFVGAMLFSSVPASAGESHGRGKSLGEARKALEQQLLPLAGAGFVGIAHSEREGEITVFVENEQAKGRVPRSYEGYEVRTKVTGRIQTLSTQVMEPLANVSDERRSEVRPLVGGISLSACVTKGAAIYLYAGTLSMVTYGDIILSNAHVIAMNPDTGDFLNIGTPIIQPGTRDEGRAEDQVGVLEAYIPIDFAPNAENYADAAVGTIDVGVNASPGEQFSEGGNYWIEGWTRVSPGDMVRKSGRTTGVTTGEVIHTNVSVVVGYGSKSAYFVDQIVVSQDNWSFGAPGDSGSAVDKNGEFVGLLFAGTEDCIVICKAEYIIDGLDIAVEPPENRRSLTISSTPGGEVVSPGEGMFLYDAGTVVQLAATADEHCHFVEWTGDVSTIGDPHAATTNITMNDSYSIAANFELDEGWHRLSISSTEGGSVTAPGEGAFVYANSTVVQLVAMPDEHCHFVEWTGNVSTVNDPQAAATNITMNDSYSIAADFELDEGWCRLSVSSTEGGSVATPGEGAFVYAANDTINLVAQPEEGYGFLRWTGDVGTIGNVTAPETTVAMNASYSITAYFDWWYPEPAALLLISSTRGGSVITPGEGTFPCTLGRPVSLVAQPDEGCWFVKWSGDVGTVADIWAASTTIIVNSPYSIRAEFGGAGGCFIATAAYGTPMAEEIQILREFRDEYLLPDPAGKALVDFYYQVSPPVAEFISEHPTLKPVVRAWLSPAVAMSTIAVNATQVEKIAVIGLLASIGVALAVWTIRRLGNGAERI
jgi:hypothetical protein